MFRVTLTRAQGKVYNSNARFRVIAAGRRFGKTFFALVLAIIKATREPNQTVWYIAPTYRQAKQLAWRMLKVMAPADRIVRVNESELTIEFVGGSIICLKGADKPDSLRGVGLHFVIFDEAADIKPDTWRRVIRPALADTLGDALFIGTPKGFNWFYDLFLHAECNDNWSAFQFTTLEGGNVTQEEIELARGEMSEQEFAQEFLASFRNLLGTVYSNFDRMLNIGDVADLGGDILIGMDFNVSPMSAVVASKAADQLHVFDEIELMNSNTEEIAKEIITRYPNRAITIYPDPSGMARKTSSPVGQTDFAILKRHGFKIVAPKKAPLIVDRVNEVQAILCNAKDERRLYVHPRCKKLIKCMEGLVYKEGSSQIDKTSGLDHMTDALGYLIHSEFPIVSRTAWTQEFLV